MVSTYIASSLQLPSPSPFTYMGQCSGVQTCIRNINVITWHIQLCHMMPWHDREVHRYAASSITRLDAYIWKTTIAAIACYAGLLVGMVNGMQRCITNSKMVLNGSVQQQITAWWDIHHNWKDSSDLSRVNSTSDVLPSCARRASMLVPRSVSVTTSLRERVQWTIDQYWPEQISNTR